MAKGSSPEDKLAKYRKKRDFKVTPEPPGGRPTEVGGRREPPEPVSSHSRRAQVKKTPPAPPLEFVIQRHDARRLHYDLRLELDGAMMSWAVPKGPSYDPNVKRLAVETEDHPMAYNQFEGHIPDGEYGAGDVLIWDRGTYETIPPGQEAAMREKGHFHVRLFGEKLDGGWHIVRTKNRTGETGQQQWLFFKAQDEQADPDRDIVSERPESVASGKRTITASELILSMGDVCRATNAPLSGDGGHYWFEIKFDGYRLLAGKAGKDVRLFTRNQHDWTARFTAIERAVGKLSARELVMDGEACVVDDQGRPSFGGLQRWLSNERAEGNLAFAVFDILWLDGHDLRRKPIEERREVLKKLLATADAPISLSTAMSGRVDELLAAAKNAGLEGLVAKRKGSMYTQGETANWIKLKFERRQECVICGYLPLKTSEQPGAVLLCSRDAPGEPLYFVGRAGSGLDDRTRSRLLKLLTPLRVPKAPVERVPKMPTARFCEPRYVCEVVFAEWTAEKVMRFPRFVGLREDKGPDDVVLEGGEAVARDEPPERPRVEVPLSNPDKVLYPRDGIRKRDVFDYYTAIAPVMLPHMRGRPIHMQRWPNGIDEAEWFQHRLPPKAPDFVRRMPFTKADAPWYKLSIGEGVKERVVIDNVETLQWLANLAAITIHQWASHAPATATNETQIRRALAQADYVCIDLDPGEKSSWADLIRVAHAVRTLLEALSLVSVVKTSGKRGLHVIIPLARGPSHEEAVVFGEQVARAVAKVLPEISTVERSKNARGGRLYVDYGQNGGGRTIVAPYTLRAADKAPVSTPIAWEEVTERLDPRELNLKTVLARVDKYGDLFAPCLEPTQSLPVLS
jgi:bifunctional non-homologous end joining protein LigD